MSTTAYRLDGTPRPDGRRPTVIHRASLQEIRRLWEARGGAPGTLPPIAGGAPTQVAPSSNSYTGDQPNYRAPRPTQPAFGPGKPVTVSVGADRTGIADSTAGLANAIAAASVTGGDVIVPQGFYRYGAGGANSLSIPANVRLIGEGEQSVFLEQRGCSTLHYEGTGQAVLFTNATAPAEQLFSAGLVNLTIDGAGLAGEVHGVFVNGLSGSGTEGKGVIGVAMRRCAIENFPGFHLKGDGLIINLRTTELTLQNFIVGAEAAKSKNLANFTQTGGAGKIITQVSFVDPFFSCSGESGAWCLFGNDAGDVRLVSGTVTSNIAKSISAAGTNGVRWLGGLFIHGTHFEGTDATQTNVAIRVAGVNGGTIDPSSCKTWGIGVQIGDPSTPTTACRGVRVFGSIEGNGQDIQTVKGGSRERTLIACNNAPVINDERLLDAVSDLIWPVVSGRAALEPETARAANAENLPPAEGMGNTFKPKRITVNIGTKPEATTVAIIVGGVTVAKLQVAVAGIFPVTFDAPAGKAWEAKVTAGALASLTSTYYPTTP